jgi:hypothetical protein
MIRDYVRGFKMKKVISIIVLKDKFVTNKK